MRDRRGPLAKLIGGTIGLTTEYSAYRKENKAARQSASGNEQLTDAEPSHKRQPSSDSGKEGLTDDEEYLRDLDETQQAQEEGTQNLQESDGGSLEQITQAILKRHPIPPTSLEEVGNGRLSMPVILPQARPGSQHRGFVRAYAPILQECGIDQSTWMDFLEGFDKSVKKNSWFEVANIAIVTASIIEISVKGFSPMIHFIAVATETSIELSRRAYLNHQRNTYLDIMNEKFFKPRGLFCLVVKYKPSSNQIMENVDLEQNIGQAIEHREGQSKWKSLISTGSSTSPHDTYVPVPAPLVFPQLDNMNNKQKEGAIKEFGHFLSDYYDRQASARFEAHNPDSNIPHAPHKEFATRYGDPNSSVSNGGIISIATGGLLSPAGRGGGRRRRGLNLQGMDGTRPREGVKRPLKQLMKQNALYLMVVNMPTQEQLDMVKAEVKHSLDGC